MQTTQPSSFPGIKIGHAQNIDGPTGCTVILCEEGATAGVDVRGGAPGTRETDLLNPVNLVDSVHGILLTGGSAFGLDAAAGVMRYLEERKVGFDVQVTTVPIVCGAALFDLAVGDPMLRPDKEMGYQACENATVDNYLQGCIGAGAGATVGKICGMDRAMKGGIGIHSFQVGDLRVLAVVAVNCLGDVIDPKTQHKLAGVLNEDKAGLADTETLMTGSYADKSNLFSGNTTIGTIITNGNFTKAQMNKLASMAQNGYARTIRPSHTMYDGDTIFALSAGKRVEADLNVAGFLAANAMEQAVVNGVKQATSLNNIPSFTDIEPR